jgi:hypothetical protein
MTLQAETRVPEKYLKDVLDVLPRGEDNRIGAKEIATLLSRRGIKISERGVKAAVEQLVNNYGQAVVSSPGNGYWIATTQAEFEKGRAFLLSLLDSLRERINRLSRNWFNQPSNGGRQLEITSDLAPVAQGSLPSSLELRVATRERKSGISPDLAVRAVYLYWKKGKDFSRIAGEVLTTKSRLEGFWNNLELPRRKRGGWGHKYSEHNYEVCMRRVKTFFEQTDGHDD